MRYCRQLVLFFSAGMLAARSGNAQPAVNFEVRFSKPLALFHYVRQLTPAARSNPYKTQFAASRFATPANLALLASLDSIKTDYEYSYPSYPEGKIEGSTLYIIKRNLVLASSLTDFRTRSIVVLPSAELDRIVTALETLSPAYDSLVYEPSRANFERQLREIENVLAEKRASQLFDRIRVFFRASWEPAVPFIFTFYPRPAGGGFSATAYGNVSESELPADMKNYGVMLSLMLHEAAHILLDEQKRDAAWEMQEWYSNNPAVTSAYAKGLMQESWSTAVGNGFFYEQLTGALSTGSWYGEKHISDMAKQMLPLMKPYLEAGKPMDRALVDAYVGVFDREFRGWLSDWGFLMMGRAVVAERQADLELIDRKFPYRNVQRYFNDFSDASLRDLRLSGATKLIVISRDHAATLDRVRAAFPELAGWRADPASDFTHATLTADKKRLIIVNLVTKSLESVLAAPLPPLT